MPSEKLLAALGTASSKTWGKPALAGEVFYPTSKGARVKFPGGKPTVVDGRLSETKELIAGFRDDPGEGREQAIKWVKRWPAIDRDGNLEIELRPVFEAEGFGVHP